MKMMFSLVASVVALSGCSGSPGTDAPLPLDGARDTSTPTTITVFHSPSATPDPEDSAADCFNPELYETDTASTLNYESSGGSSEKVKDVVEQLQVIGETNEFDGESAIKRTVSIESTDRDAESTDSRNVEYFDQIDVAALIVRTLGEKKRSAPSGVTVNAESTYEPAKETRFQLASNEQYSRSYTRTTTATADNLSGSETTQTTNTSSTSTRAEDVDETVTFWGIEDLTLAGKVFRACRFEFETTRKSYDPSDRFDPDGAAAEPQTSSSTEWLHVGSGVLLYREQGDNVKTFTGDGQVNSRSLE